MMTPPPDLREPAQVLDARDAAGGDHGHRRRQPGGVFHDFVTAGKFGSRLHPVPEMSV